MLVDEVIKKADEYILKLDKKVEKLQAEERKKELLKRYDGEDRVVSWKDIEEKVRNGGEVEKFKSGLEKFDEHLRGGIEVGRLISFSASSKSGKTTFCIDLMRKYKEYNPCMIVLEQPPEELIREQIFYGNEIPQIYSPKTFNKVSINWIEERIIESYLKYGTRVVVIDHLDFIDKNERMTNKHLQIQEVMEELKLMTRRLNVSIFLIVHINKLPPEEKPTYFNLAESSSTYKLSDITLMLWRECAKNTNNLEYSGLVNLSIELSRQGGSGENIKLLFNNGKYTEANKMDEVLADDKMKALREEKKKKYEI